MKLKRICIAIMKITCIHLALSLLFISPLFATETGAQKVLQEVITLKAQQQPLHTVLHSIEQLTSAQFMYSPALIDADRKVSVSAKNITVQHLLDELLPQLNLKYEYTDNIILILRTGKVAPVPEQEQQRQIAKLVSGKVIDRNGQPIASVSVMEKGTTHGTVTDKDGNFSLEVAGENAVLVFSYVGYVTQEIAVENKTNITVTLMEEPGSLNEVVVVGYGAVKKRDLTGSVAQIKSEDLNAYPITNVMQGLQGKASGVQVFQNSGGPGAPMNVRIRGSNSIQGNNSPLYVIDGFAIQYSPDAINPADIESIEILKDASATAIYGSRGANGVVLITTKSGRAGRSQVSLDSYVGTQEIRKKLDLLNARQFAELANERATNDGFAPYFTEEEINSFGEGTDWQEVMLQNALIHNHNLNISGGTDKSQYSVSGSYFGQDGIVLGSDYERISLRANLTQKVSDKIKLSYSTIYSITNRTANNSDNGQKGSTVTSGMLAAPPTLGPKNPDGTYTNLIAYPFSPNSIRNPLALAEAITNKQNKKYFFANAALSYEPIKNLVLRSSIGLENSSTRQDYYSPTYIPMTPTGSASISVEEATNILNENTATYSTTIHKNHAISVLGGFTFQHVDEKGVGASASGFPVDILETNSLQSGSSPGIPNSGRTKWTLMSYLGRVNYSFMNKYLLTVSLRADGSSRFGEGNKWGYFPSAALAWRIIDENFMQNSQFFSDLKLRGSWGQTGNTAIAPYQTLHSLSTVQIPFNDELYIGIMPGGNTLDNPNLKWETTTQTDIGLDVGVLKNRLSLTVDVYKKNTKDLLARVPLATSSGYMNTIQNIGEIENKGIEAGVFATIFNRAFKWNLNVNFSENKSKVKKLANGSDVYGDALGQPLEVAVNILREGEPAGVFLGYIEDGLNENGAIVYKDLNKDGIINLDDKTIIGDPNPDFIYGLNSNMSYKNFEFTFFIQGVQGNDIFNWNFASNANSFYFGENQIVDVYYNRWTPSNPNPNAKYPKVSASTKFLESDRYIEDGSYVRLKNIQLGYHFPMNKWGVKWIKDFQLYISAQNLITITDYSWFDPEMSTHSGNSSFSNGVDQTGYPTPKTYTVGLHLGF